MSEPYYITVETTGTFEHPRYRLLDSNGQYWSGSEWGPKGMLYEDANMAAVEAQQMMRQHRGTPSKYFKATVMVEVIDGDNVPLEQLREWLAKSANLTVHKNCGLGPAESLCFLTINWGFLNVYRGVEHDPV